MAEKPERSVSICVLGPSSTGKTTLCNALAQKLGLEGSAYVTEVARHVMKTKGYSRDTIDSLQMQEDIMEAHLLLEEESIAAHPILICDRTAIDPIVYAILTSRDEEEARRKQNHLTHSANFQKALQRYRQQSIVILLKPVAEWLVDDGIRSIVNQAESLEIYKRLLAEMDIVYYEFGREVMSLPERVDFILDLL